MNYNKQNQKIITGFGLVLFISTFITIFLNYQINSEQLSIIQASKVVENNLIKAQIELHKFSQSEHDLESVFPKPSMAGSIESIKSYILTDNINHNIFFYLAPQVKKPFKSILDKLLNYESLTPAKYHELLTEKGESIFITLYNQNESAQNELIRVISGLCTTLYFIQLVLSILILLYFLVAYFYIKKTRRIRNQLEQEKSTSISQLKENNNFLEQAQKISNIGYYTFNFNDSTYRASSYILETLGLPNTQLKLQTWIDCIHPNDKSILTSVLEKRQLNSDIPLDVTYRIIRPKDGVQRWIHHIADQPIKDSEGQLLFALGVIQDITTLKETEIKLLNLNQIIASSLNEIYIIDYEKATLIEVNDAVIFSLGYPKEALLKMTWFEIAPKITDVSLHDIRQKLTRTKTVVFEIYHKRQNGLTYPVEIHIQKGKNADKDVFLIIAIDISERIQAKQSLLESENRWRLAIESTNDGLWDINFKEHTYYYSKRWKEMLGYQEHEIQNIENAWETLIHPDDLERVKFSAHLLYDNITPVYRAEYRMLCKDGSYKWILDRGKVIERNEAQKPVRVIGVHTDISERIDLEIKNLEQNKQIAESDKRFKNLFDQNPLSLWENDISEVEQLLKTLNLNAADFKAYLDNNTAFVFECLSKIKTLNINNFTLKLLNETNKNEVINNISRYYNQNSFKVFKKILVAINNGDLTFSSEMEMLTSDRVLITTLISITKIEGTGRAIVSIQDITDRKLAENTVNQREKELLEVQKIAHLGSYNLDLISMKAICSEIFGQISELDTSKPIDFYNEWRILVHPEDVEGNQLALENSIKTGAKFKRDYRIITKKTKTLKWIHSIGNIVFKDGLAISFVGTIQDITERKLAQELLKNSNYILQKSQEIANIGSYSLDFATGLWESSAVLNNIFGINKETSKEVVEWLQVVHPEDREMMQNYLTKNIIANHESFKKEYRIVKQNDHKERWVHGIGELEFNVDGTLSKMIGTIQDITERKLAEVKLRQADLILNKIDSIIQVVDEKGAVIYTSPGIETLLGYKPEETLDQGWWRLTTSTVEEANTVRDAVIDNILKGKAIGANLVNRKIKTKTGDEKMLQWITSKGVNNTIIFIGIDVTERTRQELINKIIFNITKKANESISLKTFSNFIKLELGTLINTNNFFIALYDKKTDMISTPYMVDEKDEASDFPKGKTLTGYIIDTKKSLIATNSELKSLKRENKINVLGPLSKCWMGVPLMVENEAIGAIVIQSYTDVNAYTQNDVSLIEMIAANISQLIKKISDFEKIGLLNQALIQSDEAVIITDLNGTIQYVNPAFTALSGYSEQEVLGKNPRILKSGEQPIEFYEKLWNTILNGETWNSEFINKRKAGSNYLVEANISPVKNSAGVITHFIGIQKDITEKRKLERDFIHAFIDAQEQEKISFGEDLHDGISQILAAESMYVEVLNKLYKSDDARVLDALAKIKALNLSAITDARNIAHGLMSKQLKESGLIIAIEHICEDYNQSKKILFSFNNSGIAEDEISKEIKINIFRITQEITTNIIRHSGAKNSEIILTKTNQNQLRLMVKDDGVGMDLEKMEREHKGAGLKNIERRITLLNGKIKLDTAPNQGTCYTIAIPLNAPT